MRRPLLVAAVALGVGAAIVSLPVAPTAASDLPSAQAAHLAVVERIGQLDALAAEQHLGDVTGDPLAGWIEVGWTGDVPAEVQQIAAEAADEGIEVRFVPAAASAAEIADVAASFAASLPAEGAFGLQIGADGITVEVPTPDAAEAAGSEAIPLDDAAVQDAIADAQADAEALGVELVVEETEELPLSTASVVDPVGRAPVQTARTDDTSIFSGGMRVMTQFRSGAFVSCTSGFSGVYGHRPMILTAAHCSDYQDGRAVRNYSGTRIGTSELVGTLNDGSYATDLGAIALGYDARTLPRIYTGQTSTVAITHAMTARPPAGYYLCSSGQVTGWKCDLRTGGSYVACYSSVTGQECVNVIIVTSSNGRAFCLGDSGGPVVTHPNAEGATAVAVVSGIRGTPVGGCGPTGLIAPVSDLYGMVFGAQLHTTPGG